MQQIGNLLKFEKPKIKIIPKKEAISLIAQMVKFSDEPLKNWKIVARRLAPTSAEEATRIFYAIRQGTREWSKDVKGQFLSICKEIKYPKKPKQSKLFK